MLSGIQHALVWDPKKILSNSIKGKSFQLKLPDGFSDVDQLKAIILYTPGHFFTMLRSTAEGHVSYCQVDSLSTKLVYLTSMEFKKVILDLSSKHGSNCVAILIFSYDPDVVNPRIALYNDDATFIAKQLLFSLANSGKIVLFPEVDDY